MFTPVMFEKNHGSCLSALYVIIVCTYVVILCIFLTIIKLIFTQLSIRSNTVCKFTEMEPNHDTTLKDLASFKSHDQGIW